MSESFATAPCPVALVSAERRRAAAARALRALAVLLIVARRPGAARRGRDAGLAGADLGAVSRVRAGSPERRPARGRTRRADAARAAHAGEPADERPADRVPGERARTPLTRRRRGRAHRDPAGRRELRGRQRHRHRQTSRAGRASTGKRASPGSPARPRSPGTARPTWRRSAKSTCWRRATTSCCTCPTRTSPTPSPASAWSPRRRCAAVAQVGYSRLVLSACTPVFTAEKRLLVYARLTRTVPVGAARMLPGGACEPIEAPPARRRPRGRARLILPAMLVSLDPDSVSPLV